MAVKVVFLGLVLKHFNRQLVEPLRQSADSAHEAVCLISDVIRRVKDGYY